jgi:uncharacterized OB-fold protein
MTWLPDDMPAPAVSRETLPWWQAAAEHRLVVQTCNQCDTPRHPPGPICPRCRNVEHGWRELSGRGSVYSFTIVHQAFLRSLAEHVPYVVAILELDGAPGVRFISNLVDVAVEDVRIGMPVELVWDDVRPGLAVPRFRKTLEGAAPSAPRG